MTGRFKLTPGWQDFLLGSVILVLALAAALAASGATHAGNRPFAVALSLIALLMATMAGLILVPRLLAQGHWRVLESLQLFTFTGLGIFFTLLVAILALAALNTRNNLLFLIVSALLGSYLVSGILAKLVLSGLAIGYRFPDQVYAARPAYFLWVLRNEKRWVPTFSLRAETCLRRADESLDVVSLYFPFLEADRTYSRTIKHQFPLRGLYRVARVNLTTRFPFGFFQRGRVLHPDHEVLVYPEVQPIENFMHLLPFLQGECEELLKGQGESLYQIRDYHAGDSFRHIHWRSSAKTGRFMVRDFSEAHERRVCVCLDDTQRHEKFERAVILAASIVSHFHDEGAHIQLVTANGSSNPERSRNEQVVEILEMLARVQTKPSVISFWELISRQALFIRPDEVFKIVLTAVPAGSVPPPIWRTSHVVYFQQL
ncbi:MAG: DUF58 domain-containing protein [Acidobacteria bacterium]|nr:DUF58 domain-containing protein [Acidobacteriota bacterium]